MTIIKVPMNGTHVFQEFIDKSVMTFEGIELPLNDRHALKVEGDKLEKVLREAGYKEDECVGYTYRGEHMNKAFGLTGSNAYPDTLTFLSIPDFYNIPFKLSTGARWFDDIVANNSIRQNAIDCGAEPDVYSYNEE